MHPTFGHLLGEPIPAYFVMLVAGFAAAVFLAVRCARRLDIDQDLLIDLALICLVAGVAGARILHVLADGYFWDYVHLCTDPTQVVWRTVATQLECDQLGGRWNGGAHTCHPPGRDCFAWAKFWNGGLTYYGGLAGAVAAGSWFVVREGLPLWRVVDLAGLVTPLGIFFGRLGCFFAGCCFGVTTDSAIGLSFPPGSAASRKQFELQLLESKALASLPVHPSQLYEALGSLLIAIYLGLWGHPRKRFDGEVFCLSVGLYAALRFALEFLRADDRGSIAGWSTSQLVSVGLLLCVLPLWHRLSRRAPT
ncbi:MAG: prolipoprotein diacylglyceryl transferase [Proteobacteria bacterium]|nr:prolipoprotein diacylglyceryl transferase [Pseudomonadota bacterium]